ncbi:MAG TPA: glycosyltransferase family 2 protein, partial [Chitinophagaceae bacterium]|nr:glycosyltransferase family 2 protein [Chitinophagaceae bacterium]
NGIDLFPQTLPTVMEALAHCNRPYEVIVADDCSTDTSVAWLQQNYPNIIIVQNQQNSGFSVTANNGIARAVYDKVLLLNSDVQLTPGYFAGQYKYFDRPDTFGEMGRSIGWTDDITQDAAKLPGFHGAKIKTSGSYLLKDPAQMKDGLLTMYLSGANALIDREKFLLIGRLDEIFSPFYVEDFELSLRAWRLGFSCYYDYNSVCRHKISVSIKSSNRKKFVDTIYDRNKMIMHALHLEGARKFFWYCQLLPETLIRIFSGRWHYLRSLRMFFSSGKAIRQSRNAFEKVAAITHTRRSVQQVMRLILKSIPSGALKW